MVEPSQEISGKVTPSPSKFYTQYATVIALLADGKSVLESPLIVDDTRDLAKAIENMGVTTKRSKKSWAIWGEGTTLYPKDQALDAKKSIMSLSLLASVSALASRIMVVNGKEQVRSCPVPSLIKGLQKLGVDIISSNNDERPPLIIFQSRVKGGEISLEADSDPRFLPAILLLAPLAEEEVKINLNSNLEGRFLDDSLELLEKSGVETSFKNSSLEFLQSEFEPLEITPPSDLMSTIPYIVGAILTEGEINISIQDEVKNKDELLGFLNSAGIETQESEKSIKIPESQVPHASEISLEEFPELLPFFAVLACKAEGKTRLINAGKAREMKSDRINAIAEGLSRMGAKITEEENGIEVEGPTSFEGTKVDGRDDDAIVASLGIAGLLADGKTIIKNRAESLRQSYPQFVTVFKDLGANMGYEA